MALEPVKKVTTVYRSADHQAALKAELAELDKQSNKKTEKKLRYIVSSEDFALLPPDIRGLYDPHGENYRLSVFGAVDESFRTNNIQLSKERDQLVGLLKLYGDITPETAANLKQERDQTVALRDTLMPQITALLVERAQLLARIAELENKNGA